MMMITRTLTKRLTHTISRNSGLKSQRSTLPSAVTQPIRLFGISSLRLGEAAESNSNTKSRTLKASSFAQPSSQQKPDQSQQSQSKQSPAVPQEDIDDFDITQLVHGDTKLKIAITKRASEKLTSIATADNNPDSALRIKVESGGCHGFQYNLDLTNLSQDLDKDPELLVFARKDDKSGKVVFDESSLEILQDSKIDFTKELIGSSFKVVDSPYTSTECGCGASFDFDFDKLQKKLDDEGKS